MRLTAKNILLFNLMLLMIVTGASARGISPTEQGKHLFVLSLQADQKTSYSADVITKNQINNELSQIKARLFHQAPDLTHTLCVEPETVAGTILVNKGSSAYIYSHRTREWRRSCRWVREDNIDLLMKNYRFTWKGSTTVNGHLVDIVKITPKYPGNPYKTLWLDRETRIPLKSTFVNYRKELISETNLFNLKTSNRFDQRLFETEPLKARANKAPSTSWKPILPGYIPAGYVLTDRSGIQTTPGCAVHLKYSDGLNTISLFEKRIVCRKKASAENVEKKRSTNLLSWIRGDLEFTLIADLPPDELERIAATLDD